MRRRHRRIASLTPNQLIEEMLDEGHPMTMETNMLKEIVLPPTLMRKILNAAGVSG
jgi:AP-3 complex subunit mu